MKIPFLSGAAQTPGGDTGREALLSGQQLVDALEEATVAKAEQRIRVEHNDILLELERGKFTEEARKIALAEELKHQEKSNKVSNECNGFQSALKDALKVSKSACEQAKLQESAFKETWKALDLDAINGGRCCGLFRCGKFYRKFVEFSWLLVILGTEMDLLGFLIAVSTYWYAPCGSTVSWIMHLFLGYGPACYIVGTQMFMDVNGLDGALGIFECLKGQMKGKGKEVTYQDLGKAGHVQAADALPTKMSPRPVDLKFYHFMPIFRSFVILKDMNHSDVEGLFRVNALSTFSLGVAQITCMMLGLHSGCLGPISTDVSLQFGVVAQAINVFVTFIYFGTPVPQSLMNLACIQAVEYTTLEGLKEFFIRYEGAVQQNSVICSDGSKAVLDEFHQRADYEIRERSSLTGVPLDYLSMTHKLRLITALRIKSALAYESMNR